MDLVNQCSELFVSRGKKFHRFVVQDSNSTEMMKHVLGPSGKLRAPAIRAGSTLLVGFNPDAYTEALEL